MFFHEFRIILFFVASAFGCKFSNNNIDMIKINGLVNDYIVNASHDVFDDGSTAVFDAVKIMMIEPDTLKDQILTIYLTKEEAKDTNWHKNGNIINFSIDTNLLEGNRTLFLGAIDNITFQIE